MTKRARELAELGKAAYREKRIAEGEYIALIDALAVMLAAPKEKAEKVQAAKLPFSPAEFYGELRRRAGHIVLCEPVESRLFGQLGRKLQQTSGLEREDLDRVISWIEAGGLSGWPGGSPTFAHAVKHFSNWLSYSRKWDQQGRPSKGGKPAALPVEGDFK